MSERNYNTPGRIASAAATKTEPGAPRARKITKQPPLPVPIPPSDEEEDDGKIKPIQWRPESEVDADPELPPSDVPLSQHKKTEEFLRASIESFRLAGFWPNTVSALVGLRREDCDRLHHPPSYQLKQNQKPCKLRQDSKAKSPNKSCASGAKKTPKPTRELITPPGRRRLKSSQ